MRYFSKIKGFDILFEKIGNNQLCNVFTDITYGYRIRPEVLGKIGECPRFKGLRKYTRGDFKIAIKWKGEQKLYNTKKELIENEELTRWQVDNNLDIYTREIKEVFSSPFYYQYPSGNIKPDYFHKLDLDIVACNELIDDFLYHLDKNEEDALITQSEYFALDKFSRQYGNPNFDFYNHVKYKRKGGGRLHVIHTSNNICLQSLPKKAREILFKGRFYYDINASAPTILQQISVKQFNYDMPNVRKYIKAKEMYRNLLVETAGLSYQESKQFFTALFFGASLQDNFFIKGKSAFSALYGEAKIREILENAPIVVDLYVELREFIKKFGKYLKENKVVKGKDNKMYLHNGRGSAKEVNLKDWNNSKAILHWYFGEESLILDCLIRKYQHSLLLYDGFISREDCNVDEMSKLVKDSLGYDITFSKELLGERK